MSVRLIAHDIRSLHNVGAILRSADAFGVERVYLTGFTGTPPRAEIAKVSLGAEDRVAWEYTEDIRALFTRLKAEGQTIWALDNTKGAQAFGTIPQPEHLTLLLGNEVEGVDASLLALCDACVEIPLPGRKRSLNVSVAAGVALYELCARSTIIKTL